MMTLLSGLLTRLVGPLLPVVTVPALIFTAILGWHTYTKERDARIATAATNVCTANWEAAIRKEERDAAAADARATVDILTGERKVNERLTNEQATLQQQIATLKAGSSGSDARCLDDSVLGAIGASLTSGSASTKRGAPTPRNSP